QKMLPRPRGLILGLWGLIAHTQD
mgnify:CR=1